MALTFTNFRQEVRNELLNILNYWIRYDIDQENGGFYGAVNHLNQPNPKAPKGIVINSRILWTYAAAQQLFPDPQYPVMAKRAYDYIRKYFVDPLNGGVYWSVTATGEPLEKKKQIYGHAFAIYGLAEYYKISKSQEVLDLAKDIFGHVVKHSYDPVNGGYVEALNNDWSDTDDYILSKGDSRKSMNTHLHLLESFTNLYRVWKDKSSEFHLKHCLEILINRITDPETYRMTLFFTDKWEPRSTIISYGHDIEASWLIWEAAEVLGNEELITRCRTIAIEMVKAASDGLAGDGSIYYEYEPETKKLHTNKDWWPQAEAMVGFFNAYQLTGKVNFLEKSENTWNWIKKYMIDHENGEWFGALDAQNVVKSRDKINFWKCPYHNGRACMEIWHRLEK